MTRSQFVEALRTTLDALDDRATRDALAGLLGATELTGLSQRIQVALRGMLERPPFV